MRKYLSTSLLAFGLLFSVAAAPVHAASLTSAQVSAIVSLLLSFGADQSVINSVSVALGGPVPSSSCISLTQQMTIGSTDATTNGEVTSLQTFLQGKGYFTYTGAKGYYGLITADAVGRYQVAQGIVSSANDNDAGITGPQTRAAINAQCVGGPVPQPVPPTPSPVGPNTLIPSTTFMNYTVMQGDANPDAHAVVLTNTTASTITYTISVPNQPSWLNTSYNTAPLTLESGNTASVGVSVDASGLAPGTYSTTLTISGNFSTSPINIPITLTVNAPTATQLSATCHGSPYNSGTPGISWGSAPSGGTGSYAYQWTLANDPTGSGDFSNTNQQNVLTTYGSTGTKSASVRITSGIQSVTASCSATIGAPAPNLTQISPTSGTTNTVVTLHGYYFSGATEVDFYHSNGQLGWTVPSSASNISISDNSIVITISGGAVGIAGPDTYQVKIVTPGGTSNARSFTLTAPLSSAPTLSNINPMSGTTNTTVTLTGTNLGNATEVDFYHSNGQLGATIPSSASNISISANSITFTISGGMVGVAGPDTYQVKVVTPSGTSNTESLTITG